MTIVTELGMSRVPEQESAKLVHFRNLSEHVSHSNTEHFNASFIPPNAYWTSAEKAALFRGLARYSRWRLDLIRDEVGGGKTIADISSYIRLLDEGLHQARDASYTRDTLPIAYEVSRRWEHKEESLAGILQKEEHRWRKSARKRKRSQSIKEPERASLLERRDAERHSGESARDIHTGMDKDTHQDQSDERMQRMATIWRREDFLSTLKGKYLKAMEGMVRSMELAEDTRDFDQSPETSPMRLPNSIQPTFPGTPNGSQIDPAPDVQDLRSLSYQMNYDPQRSQRQTFPQPAEEKGDPIRLPSNLSPTSRRRVRKRLWMRKKRALQSGLPLSEVSTDIHKLKPGKRKRPIEGSSEEDQTAMEAVNQMLAPHASTGGEVSRMELDENPIEKEILQKERKPRGWAKLESLAIDGPSLRTSGLDLFALSNFADLKILMDDVYRFPERLDSGIEETPIFALNSLLLLRANLVHFLSRLIGRIIVLADVEAQQKTRTRTYGRPIKVKRRNVYGALGILGYENSSQEFFRRLGYAVRDCADITSEGSEETDISDRSGVSVDDEDHVDVQCPVPPPLSGLQFDWDGYHGDEEGESLLPTDTDDEESLLAELDDEEMLDRQDQAAERQFEQILWREVEVHAAEEVVAGTGSDAKELAAASTMGSGNQTLRYREPGGAIKSRVYINDSDEDLWNAPEN